MLFCAVGCATLDGSCCSRHTTVVMCIYVWWGAGSVCFAAVRVSLLACVLYAAHIHATSCNAYKCNQHGLKFLSARPTGADPILSHTHAAFQRVQHNSRVCHLFTHIFGRHIRCTLKCAGKYAG